MRKYTPINNLTKNVTSLEALIEQMKEIQTLNQLDAKYNHYRELKIRQLTILAFENINIELSNIKKQLHGIKHKTNRN